MKKIISFFLCSILLITCVSCTQNLDYENETVFETALNQGEDVTGKTVQITVNELEPQSAFGYNIQTGEHLNFCSSKHPKVQKGDVIIVKVKEVNSFLGSYIIYYEMK